MDFERLKGYYQYPQIIKIYQIFIQKQKILNLEQKCFWLFAVLNFEELLSHLMSALSNMSLSNILCKTNDFQTWNKKILIYVILGCKFEKLLPYLKWARSNLSKWKALCKTKILKFGPKDPFWVFLDWNLKKLMSYLKSAPSSLSKYQKLSKATTTITAATKNGTKNALFGYFGL